MHDSQDSTEKRSGASITVLIPVELRQNGIAVRGAVLPSVAEIIAEIEKQRDLERAGVEFFSWRRLVDGVTLDTGIGSLPVLIPADADKLMSKPVRVVLL